MPTNAGNKPRGPSTRSTRKRWLKIAEHWLQMAQEADDPSKELASYMKQHSK